MTTEVLVISNVAEDQPVVHFVIHGEVIMAKIVKGAVRLSTQERRGFSLQPEATNAISVRIGRG